LPEGFAGGVDFSALADYSALADLFVSGAPTGTVAEITVPNNDEKKRGIILVLNVIPLEGKLLTLPAKQVSYRNLLFNMPELRITILPAIAAPAAVAGGTAAPAEAAAAYGSDGKVSFPPFSPPFFFRSSLAKIAGEAELLWEGGDSAEALALLRSAERDHPAGFLIAPLRRAADAGLGFPNREDEKWRPRSIFRITLILSLLLFLLCFFISAKKKRMHKALPVLLALIAVLSAIPLGQGLIVRFLPGQTVSAVLRAAESRRVPEEESSSGIVFGSGEPVQIGAVRGEWAYVKSLAGSGWVKTGNIIKY
jgi:hypothetical protein